MVTIYGLDEKIGNVSYYDSQNQGYGFNKPYSEETAGNDGQDGQDGQDGATS